MATPWMVRGILIAAWVALVVYLVPAGSTPVGFDVWWNLHVGKTIAENGFPEAIPAAGFTTIATSGGHHGPAFLTLLAAVGGKGLDAIHVPALVWLLAGCQAMGLVWALAEFAPRATLAWMLLPWLSQTWMFRLTELRDMNLALCFLLPWLAVAATSMQRSRVRWLALGLLTLGFAVSHAAWSLLLVLMLCMMVGSRWQCGRWPWREPIVVGVALALAAVVHPDFPENLTTLVTLNLLMPMAHMQGSLGLVPTEFLAMPLRTMVLSQPGLVIGMLWIGWHVCRGRTPLPMLLSVVMLALAACMSQRLIEVAMPAMVLLLAGVQPRLPRWIVAASVAFATVVLIPVAASCASRQRHDPLLAAGEWIAGRARPGDIVFTLDWAASAPLAWQGRAAGLVCTGILDPVLMWQSDAELYAAWRAIKEARDARPLSTIRNRFGARFVAFHVLDAVPGQRPGTTANSLRVDLGKLRSEGSCFDLFVTPKPLDHRYLDNWLVIDLCAEGSCASRTTAGAVANHAGRPSGATGR